MFLRKLDKIFKKKKLCVRTRIAPSPTGPFHIGNARSALFNYLFAIQNKGKFILRIEDTDLARSDFRFEKDIIEGLKWLNLEWAEGPYRQSERLAIYKKYLEKLFNDGKAFWCPHSPDELKREKQEQMVKKEAPRHICDQKLKSQSQKLESKKEGIIRLNTSSKVVEFDDLIRGKIRFDASLLGDIALAKDANTPLYNFAVVVDDFEMKISHVIRGEDHISNTPKQILIQEALSLVEKPQYGHLPLVLGIDRSKISSRHAAVAVASYRKAGYLPEAMINFMALLGWNPGTDQEIFSLNDLVKKFDLKRVLKVVDIFNIERLDWLNGVYIRKKTQKELTSLILKEEFLKPSPEFKNDYIEKIISLEQPRLIKLSEIGERASYFFSDPAYHKALLSWQEKQPAEEIKIHIDIILNLIQKIKSRNFIKNEIKSIIWPYAEKNGRGNVLWPFRVALTGQNKSPDPFEIAEILGKEKTIARLEKAMQILNN